MSYEYRSDSSTFELPNPYRLENIIGFIVGGLMLGFGLLLLLVSRNRLEAGGSAGFFSFVPAIYLMTHGVWTIAQAMLQLRFFFGRNRPTSLAAEVGVNVTPSAASDEIIETIRRGGLHFPEPQGALNGILYQLFRNLIFAPLPLQQLAQAAFRLTVGLSGTLASFLVSWVAIGTAPYAAWVGILYLALGSAVIFKPLKTTGGTAVGDMFPVVLIVLAVFGPFCLSLYGKVLPALDWVSANLAAFSMLASATLSGALSLLAIKHQLIAAPPATTAAAQLAISMNCPPAQVFAELDRKLQTAWTEGVPNRRYAFVSPDINMTHESTGNFAALALEESQPMPMQNVRSTRLEDCNRASRHHWTLMVNLLGATLLIVATLLITVYSMGTPTDAASTGRRLLNGLVLAYAFVAAGVFAMRVSHLLWGRFDFMSLAYWIELKGNYQVGRMDYGNVLSDRIKTSKPVINVENATLRVWVVELNSVTFGKDGQRYLTAMFGCKDRADSLANELAAFALDQSIVLAPTAKKDGERLAALAALAASAGSPAPGLPPAGIAAAIGSSVVD